MATQKEINDLQNRIAALRQTATQRLGADLISNPQLADALGQQIDQMLAELENAQTAVPARLTAAWPSWWALDQQQQQRWARHVCRRASIVMTRLSPPSASWRWEIFITSTSTSGLACFAPCANCRSCSAPALSDFHLVQALTVSINLIAGKSCGSRAAIASRRTAARLVIASLPRRRARPNTRFHELFSLHQGGDGLLARQTRVRGYS